MAEPINLNKARKAKARTDAEARATENLVRFGRTKSEKTLAKALAEKVAQGLDAAKRDR